MLPVWNGPMPGRAEPANGKKKRRPHCFSHRAALVGQRHCRGRGLCRHALDTALYGVQQPNAQEPRRGDAQRCMDFRAPVPFPRTDLVLQGKQRQHLLNSRSDIDSIRDLSWADFELLIGEAFRRRGYSVEERGGGGADGGVDLVLHMGGEKILVQCKQWKSRQMGVNVVRELYGVMVHEKAARAIVAISCEFTQEAKGFARGKPLERLNGPALYRLVSQVQAGAVTQRAEPVLVTTEKDIYPGIRSVGGRGQFDDYAIMQARPQSSACQGTQDVP